MTDDRDTPPRGDPVTEFQRWLMRSGARNLGREVKGQFRRTFGGGSHHADVWEMATTEPPPAAGEAPECAWCPVCRAARRFRDSSGPGFASQFAGAGDALMSMAQDTLAAFEATLSGRPPSPPGPKAGPAEGRPGEARPAEGRPGEGSSGERRPGEGSSGERLPGEGSSAEGRPAERRPPEHRSPEGTGWPGETPPRARERTAPDGPDRRP